jgi:cytidine deaminase
MSAGGQETSVDAELIERAREAIHRNCDGLTENHTVGAAVRCANGRIYAGVNVWSLHGACAEVIAIGAAITAGERAFESIVAVRGHDGEEILPPCGNCRQILSTYAPDCEVLVPCGTSYTKVRAADLLPGAYGS